jgi:hypothetical protein
VSNDLPNWVYDVVRDLVHQEDVHPKLLFTSGGFEGAQPYDWCPCVTLAKVPAEVREHAKVLLRYLERSELVQRAEEHTEVCR